MRHSYILRNRRRDAGDFAVSKARDAVATHALGRVLHVHRQNLAHRAVIGKPGGSVRGERANLKGLVLGGGGSRLYRSQILQVNTRWKALVEIYTMHSFAPFSILKMFVKNC